MGARLPDCLTLAMLLRYISAADCVGDKAIGGRLDTDDGRTSSLKHNNMDHSMNKRVKNDERDNEKYLSKINHLSIETVIHMLM